MAEIRDARIGGKAFRSRKQFDAGGAEVGINDRDYMRSSLLDYGTEFVSSLTPGRAIDATSDRTGLAFLVAVGSLLFSANWLWSWPFGIRFSLACLSDWILLPGAHAEPDRLHTLISYVFLHRSGLHLTCSLVALAVFTYVLSGHWGDRITLGVMFAAAVVGAGAYLAFGNSPAAIGLTAVNAGLLGATVTQDSADIESVWMFRLGAVGLIVCMINVIRPDSGEWCLAIGGGLAGCVLGIVGRVCMWDV